MSKKILIAILFTILIGIVLVGSSLPNSEHNQIEEVREEVKEVEIAPVINIDPAEIYFLKGDNYDLFTGVSATYGGVVSSIANNSELEAGVYTVIYTVRYGENNLSVSNSRVVYVLEPSDDYDEDLFTNAEEIASGSNPLLNTCVPNMKKPVVKLNGDKVVTLERGYSYEEKGVSAKDSLGKKVKCQTYCDINIYMEGEYTCYYRAVDRLNSATQITRKIIVDDTIAPVINGVQDKDYIFDGVGLVPTSNASDIQSVILTKDGVNVNGYTLGTTITDFGKYTLTVIDSTNNKNVVNFTILKPKVTFHFVLDSGFEHDGKAKEFQVEVYGLNKTLLTTLNSSELSYYSENGTLLNDAPIKAGDYRVKASYPEDSMYAKTEDILDFTIKYKTFYIDNDTDLNDNLSSVFDRYDSVEIKLETKTYNLSGFTVPQGKELILDGNGATVDMSNNQVNIKGELVVEDITIDASQVSTIPSFILTNSNSSIKFNNVTLNESVSGARAITVDYNVTNAYVELSDTTINLSGGISRGVTFMGTNDGAHLKILNTTISNNNGIIEGLSRGISLYRQEDTIVEIKDSKLEGFMYVMNFGEYSNALNVDIDGSTLSGWAVFNILTNNHVINVNNSTLIGTNNYSGDYNDFATIVIETWTSNNTINLNNTSVYAYENSDSRQYAVDNRSRDLSSITINGALAVYDAPFDPYPDDGKDELRDYIIINSILY